MRRRDIALVLALVCGLAACTGSESSTPPLEGVASPEGSKQVTETGTVELDEAELIQLAAEAVVRESAYGDDYLARSDGVVTDLGDRWQVDFVLKPEFLVRSGSPRVIVSQVTGEVVEVINLR